MKLLLIILTLFFLSLVSGKEREVTEINRDCAEVVIEDMQISSEVSLLVMPNWYRSYLFMLNILDPVKQFDLSSDHDKSWYNLHSRFLRSLGDSKILIQQQSSRVLKYLRLLAARYINGFYIYTLEKLLI